MGAGGGRWRVGEAGDRSSFSELLAPTNREPTLAIRVFEQTCLPELTTMTNPAPAPDRREPSEELNSDPFLDPSLGPEAWKTAGIQGRRYWWLVLLLAVGLTGFSAYWRHRIVPAQSLQWQEPTPFAVRQAVGLGRPILIAISASDAKSDWANQIEPESQTAEDEGVDAGSAGTDVAAETLELALAGLDRESVRVAVRMHSAYLFQISDDSDPVAVQLLLGPAPPVGLGLVLWHPPSKPREWIATSAIEPDSVLEWLSSESQP